MGCECLKEMVGTRRLELLTSHVSKFPVAVQLTTYGRWGPPSNAETRGSRSFCR